MGGSAPRGVPVVNRPTLPVGAATGIGSLGLDDHAEACDFVFDHTPALPAAPSLPSANSRESIIGQAAAGLDGVEIGDDGALEVDTARLLATDPERAGSLDGPEFQGLRTFVDAALARRNATDGSPSRLKFQLTGPVTFGLALAGEGVPIDDAFPFAGSVVRARAQAFAELFRSRIPEVTPVVFVDEPGLTSMTHPGFPLVPGDTVRLVESVLHTFDDDTLTGIHCCGSTDWAAVIAAGPDVLSTPLDCGLGFAGAELSRFLQEGRVGRVGSGSHRSTVGDDDRPLLAGTLGGLGPAGRGRVRPGAPPDPGTGHTRLRVGRLPGVAGGTGVPTGQHPGRPPPLPGRRPPASGRSLNLGLQVGA